MSKYTSVIGLEVHVELKTNSKMFCSCSADYFGQKPNTHTCPVCLGLPGALPFPNKTAIKWCVMIGMALNCEIPLFSKFDRKNYFYPDLSKGYQISQYDQPFCINGHITLSNGKKIGITRVHMEEDTGKLIHDGKSSLIDFNRSGVPLVEIVTEPDFETAEEVKEYLQKLQQIVRYLNVSNADMEKGNMRLEPNISLRLSNTKALPNYKVEVKNINSFSFVSKAIEFELKRQEEILASGKTPVQETRGYVEKSSSTISQRVKEEASDYRYFPEPDIPPIRWTQNELNTFKHDLPKLPDERIKNYLNLGLSAQASATIAKEIETSNLFEQTLEIAQKENIKALDLANYIINKKINAENFLPAQIIKELKESKKVEDIDQSQLKTIIKQVISNNPKIKDDYNAGKDSVIQFAIGQVMYIVKKKIDINLLKLLILDELK